MDASHTINGMIVEQIWKKHYRKRRGKYRKCSLKCSGYEDKCRKIFVELTFTLHIQFHTSMI